MLLKIKTFTQTEISCTKVKFAKPSSAGMGIVCVSGVRYVASEFFSVMGVICVSLCVLKTDV